MVMYGGKIVEKAAVRQVFEEPLHPYTKGLLNSIPKLGQKRLRLEAIQGNVPSLNALPKGCRFHPRCPLVSDICTRELPSLKEVRPGHHVACWNVDQA
jgi:oligopeptide/dipeptide ABC transporter ATP-binding protein